MCTCANSSAARPGPGRTTVRQVKRLSRDRKSVSDPSLETLPYPPCIHNIIYKYTYKRCTQKFIWNYNVFTGVIGLTKPVPPPKPAKSPQNYQQTPGPPPYRMPPYPLYNESTPLPGSSNKIHTHSSKFPVSKTIHHFEMYSIFFSYHGNMCNVHTAWENVPRSFGESYRAILLHYMIGHENVDVTKINYWYASKQFHKNYVLGG